MENRAQNIIEFTVIYNRHKTKLYNYALKMLYDKMLCEDIIQNAFVKLFESLEKVRNKESIQYWLFTTVRNEIYSHFRDRKSHVDQFFTEDSDEVEISSEKNIHDDFEEKELRELIMNELNKMTIEQRDIFLLKEYGGFSYKEISGIIGIDEELVKSRLYKTRQKLIKKLSIVVK